MLFPEKGKNASKYSEHVPGEILYRANGKAEHL
jgi:hypothetical protein